MTSGQLHRHIKRAPFQPFTIHMADGERLAVRHPELILHLPGTRTFVVAHEEDETYSTMDLLLVSRITTKPRASGRGRSNGRAA